MARKTQPSRYNTNKCQFCGIEQEPGEWYWVDVECSICSNCAPGKGVKIARNKYRKNNATESCRSVYTKAVK